MSEAQIIDLKKQSYHHGNLFEALIEAGTKILEEEGIEQLSLRRMARECNVSQAAPYTYFKTKNDLLAAIAEGGFQKLAMSMVDNALGIHNSMERIEELALSYLEFATENPGLFHLMFGRELANISDYLTLAMTAGKSYSLFSSAITAHLECKQDGRDPRALTVTTWGMVHGLAGLMVDGKISIHNVDAKDNAAFVRNILDSVKL